VFLISEALLKRFRRALKAALVYLRRLFRSAYMVRDVSPSRSCGIGSQCVSSQNPRWWAHMNFAISAISAMICRRAKSLRSSAVKITAVRSGR
jgi:hypothetical protein